MMRRRDFMKAAVLAGGALCSGHFPLRSSLAQGSSRKVVVGQGGDMASLDPYGHSATFNYAMWKHIMEPLFQYDYGSKRFRGVLAESWKAEGTEWTFHLRKGVKFHNGADFTARDVAFSFEKVKASKQAAHLRMMKDLQVLDNYTVKMITKEPNAAFFEQFRSLSMVSHQAYQQYGKEAIQRPIGTGPFKFAEWVRGSHFVAQRNENYWGKPAQIDQIIWKPIPEDAARVTAVETGAVDIATNIPPHEAERLAKNPNLRVEGIRALRIIQVALSPRFKPFQNRLVRLAMNHAVDVDSLIKYVLDGKAYRAVGLASPETFGHAPDLKPYAYDPAKAKSYLAQAGYPNGFEVDYYSPSGRYVKDKEVSQAIVAQLAKVGIKANLITPEWSTFWSGVMDGKYPMFMFGGFNFGDPDYYLAIYFESKVTKRVGYSNPEVDRGLKEQRQEFDPEKREKLLRAVLKKIHEDAPSIVLWHPQDLYGVNRKLAWKASPDEEVLLHEASIRDR